ncbi:MAG: LamB/YcsF family protein [Candidatus Gastranaerophilales bacterium]|nr:LamB/YcsF family protein [Candidatus Gastranaerophilales bacterium]
MFDFNCDVAQGYGIYNNKNEYEIAQYCSSINISAGFHAGDPINIREAFLYALSHNVALCAHIGFPDIQGFGKRTMKLSDEELEAVVIYQIGAIISYAKTYDLEIESIRCHGALKNELNNDEHSAIVIAQAVKKVSPWLNIIVNNENAQEIISKEGVKTALEYEFKEDDEISSIPKNVDTIHFTSLESIKKAYNVEKPAPINYNRVQNQI